MVSTELLLVQRIRYDALELSSEAVAHEFLYIHDRYIVFATEPVAFRSTRRSRPIPTSGGGGGSISDLRWDGHTPDEEEDGYRRRGLLQVAMMVNSKGIKRKR